MMKKARNTADNEISLEICGDLVYNIISNAVNQTYVPCTAERKINGKSNQLFNKLMVQIRRIVPVDSLSRVSGLRGMAFYGVLS